MANLFLVKFISSTYHKLLLTIFQVPLMSGLWYIIPFIAKSKVNLSLASFSAEGGIGGFSKAGSIGKCRFNLSISELRFFKTWITGTR